MGAKRSALVLGCVVAVALPAAGAQAATPRIVYTAVAADGNDTELFTIRPDGSRRRRLTRGELHDSSPSWSPNHRWIVFQRSPTCADENPCDGSDPERPLAIIRADGKRFRQVPNTVGAFGPSWSPDGRRIAFTDHVGNGIVGIYTIRPDGTGRRLVTQGDDIPSGPDWSPNSRRMVFGFSPNGIATIGVGGGERRIVARFGRNPDWGPNGKRIAFQGHRRSEVGTIGEIYTARPDGSRRRRVTARRPKLLCNAGFHCERFTRDPAWSPSGRRLAFTEYAGIRDPVLYTIRANGRGVRRIARGGSDADW